MSHNNADYRVQTRVGTISLVTSGPPAEDWFPRLALEHQETAVVILEGMGLGGAAKALRAADVSYVWSEYDNWDGGTDIFDAHLTVDASRLGDYSEETIEQIRDALKSLSSRSTGSGWVRS